MPDKSPTAAAVGQPWQSLMDPEHPAWVKYIQSVQKLERSEAARVNAQLVLERAKEEASRAQLAMEMSELQFAEDADNVAAAVRGIAERPSDYDKIREQLHALFNYPSAVSPRLRDALGRLREAVLEAEARWQAGETQASEELVILDVPRQPALRLKGRIRSVRPGSNELCLTPEQVRVIIAGGDDA